MTKKLSSTFIELTQDAVLKALWFKPSLRLFLQQHGIKDSALSNWHADQSKRDFIQWLWPKLIKTDEGHNAILKMARSLAEMEHFPDLERKEDTKIRITEAKESVARLRAQVLKINETLRESKEAEQRRKAAQLEIAKKIVSQQSAEKLEKQLHDLVSQLGTQDGGYAFEKWFYDLSIFYELEARPSYMASGRQIDGAITIDSTTFLLETKFTRNPVGSPEVDVFMAKIESKSDNTMGILVSISGFNENAIKSASKPRTPMLLLDHNHIFNLVLRGVMSLPELVSRVKRHASQTGAAYLSHDEF